MGGGWTTDQVLRIMKDSYLGTFGVLGLITSFLLKGNALLLLEPSQVPLALVLMHSYPRFGAVLLQNISSYVQRDEHSKMRLLAAPHSPWRLVVAGLASVVLAALLVEGVFLLSFLVGGFVIVLLMRRYLNKRLGGYTGDCLGALEQILELFVVLWLALF
jgi:adenosylcobinamide-GDP ribazoletransferase